MHCFFHSEDCQAAGSGEDNSSMIICSGRPAAAFTSFVFLSALNRGLTQWKDFLDIHRNMLQRIRAEGGDLLAAFYCPHRPDEACDCRKPRPGMLRAAADLYGVPLHAATMMGDKLTDLEAARAAGCRPVLIRRPGTEAAAEPPPEGAANIAVYGSLAEAVEALFTLRACPKTSS
jgi:D-glycero-D-manno-heptose 1,7-bisphosphate phosphatase